VEQQHVITLCQDRDELIQEASLSSLTRVDSHAPTKVVQEMSIITAIIVVISTVNITKSCISFDDCLELCLRYVHRQISLSESCLPHSSLIMKSIVAVPLIVSRRFTLRPFGWTLNISMYPSCVPSKRTHNYKPSNQHESRLFLLLVQLSEKTWRCMWETLVQDGTRFTCLLRLTFTELLRLLCIWRLIHATDNNHSFRFTEVKYRKYKQQ